MPTRPILLAVVAAVVLTSLPAAADQVETHVIGWSPDEQAFAVRRFIIPDDFEDEGDEHCPGYIDHRGKPFRGTLQLELHRLGESVRTFALQNESGDFPEIGVVEEEKAEIFVIQEQMPCTPQAEAKKRLQGAKAALAKAGISLKATGTSIGGPDEKTPVRMWGKRWRFDNHHSAVGINGPADASGMAQLLGYRALCVAEQSDGLPECACTASTRVNYSMMGAGSFSYRLASVDLSPSKRTAVVWEDAVSSSMRGGSIDRHVFCALAQH